ncbi:MAG TPA: DUF169 domain-containing protein [Pelomicrobium sp.]|nr:DUF169 domain-containing protein [Pelomicrobium sp.]
MDYQAIATTLQSALALRQPPVAVCLTDHVPEGVPLHQGRVPAGCVFWQQAAQGAFATAAGDHELCAVGVYTHNLAQPSAAYEGELASVLKVMAGMEYVREEDVARIPVMARRVGYVVYAPLAQTPLPPDAVLIFADSRQALVLTEAIQQVEPAVPPALGRPACAVVPQAVNSGRAALSLGCCGARAYLDVFTDEVGLWALPGPTVDQYARRVEALAKANDTLGRFHRLRRVDVESGGQPTYAESLARLGG